MINILIIDRKRLFSEGIGVFLSKEENMNVFGPEESIKSIKNTLANENLQVVLINSLIPTLNVLELTSYISSKYPDIKIIHYTSELDEDLIIQSISHGADSIVLETVNPTHLIQSIHAIINGATFFSREITKLLAAKIRDFEFDEKVKFHRKLTEHDIHLTQREIDVAILVKKGYANKVIAKKLGLSEGTVKNYVSELYRAFEKDNRKELINHIRQM